jgi:ankyrin repeat protein
MICDVIQVCDLLLQRGASANSLDMLGRTPLELATFNGHENVIRMLIDTGAEVRDLSHCSRKKVFKAGKAFISV